MSIKAAVAFATLACASPLLALPPGAWQPEVLTLGTVHSMHLQRGTGYTLSELAEQIRMVKPDLVCGEMSPEDHQSEREGFYPLEVPVVEEAAKSVGATFWPADWRPLVHVTVSADMEKEMTPEERTRFDKAYEDFMPRFKAAHGTGFFEFLHRPDTQANFRRIHDVMIDAGTDATAGFWDTRNQAIVKRCMRKGEAMKAKRILFVFGAEHNYGIQDFVKRFYGLDVRPMKRLAPVSNTPQSDQVVARWTKIRDDLVRVVDSGKLPPALATAMKQRKIADKLSTAVTTRGVAQ